MIYSDINTTIVLIWEIWDNFEILQEWYSGIYANIYPQKVFQIKLKYHCSKPIELQKFLM